MVHRCGLRPDGGEVSLNIFRLQLADQGQTEKQRGRAGGRSDGGCGGPPPPDF